MTGEEIGRLRADAYVSFCECKAPEGSAEYRRAEAILDGVEGLVRMIEMRKSE